MLGIDLRDLWRAGGGASKLTWRRLGVLVDALPGESLTKTAIRDEIPDDQLARLAKQREGHGRWSHTDLLLAAVIDAVGALRADLYRSHGGKATYPEPWPRPGVVTKRGGKVRALNDAGRAYLQRLRDEHARLYPDGEEQAHDAGG